MRFLSHFDSRHPAIVAVTGTVSGIASLSIPYIDALTQIFGLIGAAAGALVAVLSAVIKWQSWRRSRRDK